jgi:hypothetical protein
MSGRRGLLCTLEPLLTCYEHEGPERDGCYVSSYLWEKWILAQQTEVLLLELTSGSSAATLSVVGHHSGGDETLYVPQRVLDDFGTTEARVRMVKEDPPRATSITLQAVDEVAYSCDIVSTVSAELANWNVLTVGTVLTVACEELGGYQVQILVKACEPAETVLLRDEVPLVLEEALIGSSGGASQPKPQEVKQEPEAAQEMEPFDFSSMVSVAAQAEPPVKRQKFVPFGGTGHSLR